MSNEALAPLYPLGSETAAALSFPSGGVRKTAPLLWANWAGIESEPRPNPAPNRPENMTSHSQLLEQLAALSTLANSLQQTAESVNQAHAIFLRNQDAALDQIHQISTLLQALKDRN